MYRELASQTSQDPSRNITISGDIPPLIYASSQSSSSQSSRSSSNTSSIKSSQVSLIPSEGTPSRVSISPGIKTSQSESYTPEPSPDIPSVTIGGETYGIYRSQGQYS